MKLYIKEGCPWCIEAKAYLEKHGFTYQKIEVRSNPAAMQEMKEISGQTLAPTLLVDDKVLADFDTGELETFLERHNITNAQ